MYHHFDIFCIATIITQPRCFSSRLMYGNVCWYTHYLFPPFSCCCREFIFPADCVDVFSFFPSVRSKVIILIILHTSNEGIHNLLGRRVQFKFELILPRYQRMNH